ncbi:MAG: hypothetical protein RSF37_07725, partial [Clostridium sp.]|uniref:hypothetical protein n=1 Tax=Clostridium sp. TaxID=1506 RepID=UPI002FCB325C
VRSTSFVEPFNAHFCVDACANDLCIVNYSTKLLSKDYEVVCDDALYFSTFFEICIKFNKDIDLPEKCFYDSIHSVK